MKQRITISVKMIMCILSFTSSSIINAQPNCQWAKGYGGVENEAGNGIAVDAFGNVYTIGNFNSPTIVFGATTLTNIDNTGYSSDIFIVKSDSCGNVLWAKHAGDEAYDDRGTAIAVDKTGDVYVTGSSYAYNITFGSYALQNTGTGFCTYVAKYNSAGTVQWAKVMDPTGTVLSSGISVDKNNNVYVSGYYASDSVNVSGTFLKGNGSDYNSFLVKYDVNGGLQWAKSAGAGSNQAYSIATDTTGNIFIAGSYYDSIRIENIVLPGQSNYDVYIAKYNSAGNVVWAKNAGGDYDDQASGIATDKNGNVYVTGYFGSDSISFGTNKLFLSSTFSYANGFLAKYNSAGTAQWAEQIAGLEIYMQSVTTNPVGDIFVGGNFYSSSISLGTITLNNITTSDTTADILLAKYDLNGNVKWAKSAGGLRNDYIEQVTIGANGSPTIIGEYATNAITFGQSTLTNTGKYDVFITNDITRNGTVTPMLCEVTVDSLSQNNVIYWDKTPYNNVKDFIIYREVGTNNYKPIASIPYDSLSLFVDTVRTKYFPNTGDPNIGTYRYKIQIKDTTGNYSLLSPYHNTIYIDVNPSTGVFSWNPGYVIEGAPNPVNTYVLIRDNNNTNVWTTVGSISGTQSTIADPAYSAYTNGRWRVETVWISPFSCTPTRGSISTTRSNIKSAAALSVTDIEKLNNETSIYPTPAVNNVFIQYPSGFKKYQLQIINALGQLVYDQELSNDGAYNGLITKQINVSAYRKGIYIINIQTESGNTFKRFVIQ